jgi:CDI immunity proteins
MKQFDRSKSLQQLGWQDWGEATYDSHIVTECHRLRRVPLGEYKVEDLRITIGQNLGLEYLVPLALEQLQEDPFAEGAYFPGDLLVTVLGAKGEFWQAHPELRDHIATVAERAISSFPTVPDIARQTVTIAVTGAYKDFRKRQAKAP